MPEVDEAETGRFSAGGWAPTARPPSWEASADEEGSSVVEEEGALGLRLRAIREGEMGY